MTTTIFQIIAGILAAVFLYYGMDVRRKNGSRDFIAPAWQTLMKVCSCALIGITAWTILSLRQVNFSDWVDLAVVTSRTDGPESTSGCGPILREEPRSGRVR